MTSILNHMPILYLPDSTTCRFRNNLLLILLIFCLLLCPAGYALSGSNPNFINPDAGPASYSSFLIENTKGNNFTTHPRAASSAIKVSNIFKRCTPDKTHFTVLFEISGGHPSTYKVIDKLTGHETGSLYSSFFVSDPMPSSTSYSFLVCDAYSSDTIEVKGFHNCADKDTELLDPFKFSNSIIFEDYTKSPAQKDLTENETGADRGQNVIKVINISRNCTEDRANYILLFEIFSSSSSTFKVIDNATGKETGSMFANLFESNLIPSGASYSYSIFDTNGSDTLLLEGDYYCGQLKKPVAEINPEKEKPAKSTRASKKKKSSKKQSHILNPNMNLFGDDPGYDELSIFIDVPPVGGGEIDVVIKEQDVYLPVVDLFDFLKIKTIASENLDTISGFFINQDATYKIDRVSNKIEYDDKVWELEHGDLIRTDWNLYLKGIYLGKIFGLDCMFDFRNMSVKVLTDLELPIIREMRLAELRKNLIRLKGEVKSDTTIKRKYKFLSLVIADWSVHITKQLKQPIEARGSLNLGSIIAGGEAKASLNFNSQSKFTEKQQFYLWRRVNNDSKVLRQVRAGKINPNATASIYNPVVGVQFTNTPTTFRKSFGSFILSDVTEPGWIVELYVNNVMIDYAKADAAGFFSFEVPMVYGNSMIKLKFYGPWGEERTREHNITVPYSFIPVKKLEYTLSGGVVEDSAYSRFSKAGFNYGLSRRITFGGGVEYLASVKSDPVMPYLISNIRLSSNILLKGEYNHGIRYKGSLRYRLPSSIELNLHYVKYEKGQKALRNSFLEERTVSFSMPVHMRRFNAYNRVSVNQLVLPSTNYTTAEWLFSGSLYKLNMNITSYAFFLPDYDPYVYSYFSLSYRFPRDLTITTQVQYGYADKKLISSKVGLEKRIFKNGYMQMSYEQNFKSNLYMGEFGFRYDFNFAQSGFSARQSDRSTTFAQYASGSLIYDRKTKYLNANKLTSVAKGGITFIPFIDKNGNCKLDEGEPKVAGLKLSTTGGRIEKNKNDTVIRLMSLEPYTNYFIKLDQNSLDNLAWRLKHKTLTIAVVPNMIKLIEVPIYVVGEAAGTVMMEKKGELFGLSRVIVKFYDKDQKFVGKTLTEQDGYFSYFGLEPGTYTARVDSKQLSKLNLMATPESFEFKVSSVMEGDYVDGFDFIIKRKQKKKSEVPAKQNGQ